MESLIDTKPIPVDANRGTGRTTRMLEAACESASQGHNVVIVASFHLGMDLLPRAQEKFSDTKLSPSSKRLSFPAGGSITLFLDNSPEISWSDGTIRGWRNCPIYFDHYSIESRFAWAFREAHRFDVTKA